MTDRTIDIPEALAALLDSKLDITAIMQSSPQGPGRYRVTLAVVARVSLRLDGAAARPLPAIVCVDADVELGTVQFLGIGMQVWKAEIDPRTGGRLDPFAEALSEDDAGWTNPSPAPDPAPTIVYEMHDDPQPHWMRIDQGVADDPEPSRGLGHRWPVGTVLRCPGDVPNG